MFVIPSPNDRRVFPNKCSPLNHILRQFFSVSQLLYLDPLFDVVGAMATLKTSSFNEKLDREADHFRSTRGFTSAREDYRESTGGW